MKAMLDIMEIERCVSWRALPFREAAEKRALEAEGESRRLKSEVGSPEGAADSLVCWLGEIDYGVIRTKGRC